MIPTCILLKARKAKKTATTNTSAIDHLPECLTNHLTKLESFILFENSSNISIEKAKEYFNTTEILNRQVLPLRQNHKRKVQEYFKQEND